MISQHELGLVENHTRDLLVFVIASRDYQQPPTKNKSHCKGLWR